MKNVFQIGKTETNLIHFKRLEKKVTMWYNKKKFQLKKENGNKLHWKQILQNASI